MNNCCMLIPKSYWNLESQVPQIPTEEKGEKAEPRKKKKQRNNIFQQMEQKRSAVAGDGGVGEKQKGQLVGWRRKRETRRARAARGRRWRRKAVPSVAEPSWGRRPRNVHVKWSLAHSKKMDLVPTLFSDPLSSSTKPPNSPALKLNLESGMPKGEEGSGDGEAGKAAGP